MVRKARPSTSSSPRELGPVVGSHTGPGSVGVSFIAKARSGAPVRTAGSTGSRLSSLPMEDQATNPRSGNGVPAALSQADCPPRWPTPSRTRSKRPGPRRPAPHPRRPGTGLRDHHRRDGAHLRRRHVHAWSASSTSTSSTAECGRRTLARRDFRRRRCFAWSRRGTRCPRRAEVPESNPPGRHPRARVPPGSPRPSTRPGPTCRRWSSRASRRPPATSPVAS